MRTTTNTLLCDTTITPDGCVLVIEDIGASGVSGIYVHADIEHSAELVQQTLWVHTMSYHECEVVGRPVRVRVFSGSDVHGLGAPAFDGRINVASGVLAVGDRRNPSRQLFFCSPSTIRLSVFVGHDIEVIRFDDPGVSYPTSGPSDITVLLHENADSPCTKWGHE